MTYGKRRAPGNGLRQFAMSVMLKVQKKSKTTYNVVADELVREVAYDNYRMRAPRVSVCKYWKLIVDYNCDHCQQNLSMVDWVIRVSRPKQC